MSEKHIPGSRPEWDLKLPDGYENSLVTEDGKNWDNGYNFDERDSGRNEDKKDVVSEFDAEKAKREYERVKRELEKRDNKNEDSTA